MVEYCEVRNVYAKQLKDKMTELRDKGNDGSINEQGLFTNVICELDYRVAKQPIISNTGVLLCPKCELPIPETVYDHYCGFCGQFIQKSR